MLYRFVFFFACIWRLSVENCDSTLNLDEPTWWINLMNQLDESTWWTKLHQQPPNGFPDLAPWIAARLHTKLMLATLPASSLALVSLQADEIWDDLCVVYVQDSWRIKSFMHSFRCALLLVAQRFASGTALAIIPAHLKILSLRSADGVSALTLLLTNVQQMFASWNMLVLKFPQMQMCLVCLDSSLPT